MSDDSLPPPPTPGPPSAVARPRSWPLVVGLVLGAAAVFGAGFVVGSFSSGSDDEATDATHAGDSAIPTTGVVATTVTQPAVTSTTTATTTTLRVTTTTAQPTTTTQQPVEIGPGDIEVDYLVLEENCFNTAGSTMRVELQPVLAMTSSLSLDEVATLRFLVTYDIINTEGGTTRGSIDVDEGQYATESQRLSFERCDTNPDIVVTDVIQR